MPLSGTRPMKTGDMFAVCQTGGTRQTKRATSPLPQLCRVPNVRHTANMVFAVCPMFAVCCLSGTQQRHYLPCAKETAHGEHRAHGKDHICRVPYVGHRQSCGNELVTSFCLPCATHLAHGKHVSSFHWPCAAKGHTAKSSKKI